MKVPTANAILLFGICVCSVLHAQSTNLKPVEGEAHGIIFRLLPEQRYYDIKQKISVSVSVTNEGSIPVYIQRELGLCPTYFGGVSLVVFDPQGRRSRERRCGDPFRIDFNGRDVLAVVSEKMILLYPKYSYSYVVTVEDVPFRPGRYTITATLAPLSFTNEEMLSLRSLSHPVLFERLKNTVTVVRKASR